MQHTEMQRSALEQIERLHVEHRSGSDRHLCFPTAYVQIACFLLIFIYPFQELCFSKDSVFIPCHFEFKIWQTWTFSDAVLDNHLPTLMTNAHSFADYSLVFPLLSLHFPRGLRPGRNLEADDIVPELARSIHPRERPDWEETISAMVRCEFLTHTQCTNSLVFKRTPVNSQVS